MRIAGAIISFVVYGIIASLVVYAIKEYLPFVSIRYSIYVFMVLALLISIFTFLYENSRKIKFTYIYLSILAVISLLYLLYIILNSVSVLHADSFSFGVDYSLFASLFLIPFALKFARKFLDVREKSKSQTS